MPDEARETEEPGGRYAWLRQRHTELLGKYQAVVERRGHIASLGRWLLHNARDGVAVARGASLRTANRRFHQFCSSGRRWTILSIAGLESDQPLLRLLLQQAERLPEDPDAILSLTLRSEHPKFCLVEATLQRLDGDEGEVVLLLRDVTDSELLRRELEEAARRDRFLAMLAHELRNPLAPIISAAEVILRSEDPEQIRRAAHAILSQGQHQARLVADLLDTARVRQDKVLLTRSPEDLGAAAREAFAATDAVRQVHGVEGRLSLPEEPVWVEGDRTRLVQCLVNLLNNAAKFTPAGGCNELELEASGEFAWVRVRDNGVGMDGDVLPRVFDVFAQADQTLDRAEGGLGLGLSLVKNLVELHGGGVRAFSDGNGRGAEFTFWLPRGAAPEAVAPEPPVHGVSSTPLRRRVLLVEDNVDARETLAELLLDEGHEVLTAGSGPAGLELARREEPDAVITDIGLPGMDGYELARELRAALPWATLVALTGYARPEGEQQSRADAFDAYLVKPVDFATLLRALDERPGVNAA